MGIFRRARASEAEPAEGSALAVEPAAPDGAPAPLEDAADHLSEKAEPAAADRRAGPHDVADLPDRGSRIDLGAIWLPGVDGMSLRLETAAAGGAVTGVAIALDGSSLQVQAFAAPRSAGIWDEIRAEIAESVTKQGGSADDLPGPFGRELLARLPVRTPEGRTGHRPARFIGADGPRWFLRGVLSGRAAVEPEAATPLEGIFAGIVVVRGGEARAPRELLPLTPPTAAPVAPDRDARGLIDPFKRGPEITEVH